MKNLLGVSPSKRNHGTTRGKEKILLTSVSLQNRRDFLRILGEKRGKRGEREASAKREWRARGGALKDSPPLARHLRFALASLLPLSPEIREEFRVFCRLLLS